MGMCSFSISQFYISNFRIHHSFQGFEERDMENYYH